MEALTGCDLIKRRVELEEAGASAIGKLMFAFGRLEFALALAVRSIDGGKYLGTSSSLHARLEAFRRAINSRAREAGIHREPYDSWMVKADRLRQVRNDLVHGRWDTDPESMTVLNVVATQDLTEQRSTPYKVSELQSLAAEVTELQKSLTDLILKNEL